MAYDTIIDVTIETVHEISTKMINPVAGKVSSLLDAFSFED